ncbi:MAG: UDP-2,3-diacylglucosamine diphosphatase [Candidatus Cloacimonetes bacterium]|nr:UDP-2,3-diacylglucosamine diphosphatase [Candidatus Cloacimonadota bacterium]
MKYVIASDFHLKFYEKQSDCERRLRVETFLKSLIGKIDCLILAGDIFDLWIEWDSVIIKNYFSTLKILSQIKDSGCKMVYLSGNHDFWLDNFLENTIGFDIHENFFVATVNGKKIFVSHGDLYTKNDFRYQFFRRIIRSKIVRIFCKILHPNIVLFFGHKLSRSSRDRKMNSKICKNKEAGLIKKAELLSKEYDLIVFGHTHNPVKIDFGNSLYINCGDWINHSSYCYFDKDICEIRYLNTPSLSIDDINNKNKNETC